MPVQFATYYLTFSIKGIVNITQSVVGSGNGKLKI